MENNTSIYQTRLQKGGALFEDMRALIRLLDNNLLSQRENIINENLLGKSTRSRSADIIRRSFIPRFIEGDPKEAWTLVKPLESNKIPVNIIKPIYYWITARSERILYDYVTTSLILLRKSPNSVINTNDVCKWLVEKQNEKGFKWTTMVTQKVARGMLATLRDFDILEGSVKKRISPSYIPVESFSYILFILHELGITGSQLIKHTDWLLFLLNFTEVEHMLLEAHQKQLIYYSAAGSIIRIEFEQKTIGEMAHAIAGRISRDS